MSSMFKKATKKQAKLRAVFEGPSGSGKTYSALRVARSIVGPTGRIVLLDSETRSAAKYADDPDCAGEFDTAEIDGDYNPQRLIVALREAHKEGYDIVIADSLTHFWNGPGGFLELIDHEVKKMAARGNKADSFAAWKTVDPIYRRWIQDILAVPVHFIGTLRAKTEHEKTTDDRGKPVVKKLGMAPEMRAGFEYEFDLEAMLNMDNVLSIGKTRCKALRGRIFEMPGDDLGSILRKWLDDGAAPEPEIDLTRTPAPTQPPPGPNDTIPAPPRVPSLVVELTTALEAAVGNPEALVEIRKDIAAKAKEKLISREEFEALGVVYNRVRSTAA